ncbi:MAG: CopG family ribbon-helix-helix protein [Rhodospirillales bacterium]
MSTTSMTFRAQEELVERLERLAKATDRTRSWHMEKALARYLELQSWQVEHIRQGLADMEAGRVVGHDRVESWLKNWGTGREGEPPL